jgi:hypothetical protein
MAKILTVELQKIPKNINVGDDINDITVVTKIKFHDFDVKLEMPYCLHVFVYDIHGDVDAPLILPNWDESILMPVSLDRKDVLLGKEVIMVNADQSEVIINTPMALKLGQFNREMSPTTRKLEVFATIAPVIARASKYSEPFTTNLSY